MSVQRWSSSGRRRCLHYSTSRGARASLSWYSLVGRFNARASHAWTDRYAHHRLYLRPFYPPWRPFLSCNFSKYIRFLLVYVEEFDEKKMTSRGVKNSWREFLGTHFPPVSPSYPGDINPHISISFQNFLIINTVLESSHQGESIDATDHSFFFKQRKYFVDPKHTVP